MSKFVLYARRSSDEKKRKQVKSIPDQLKACKEFAEAKNLNVVEIIEESHSAWSSPRPLFEKLYKDLQQNKYDGLLVYAIDRMSRKKLYEDIPRGAAVLAQGVKIVSVLEGEFANTPDGQKMLADKLIEAAYYSDKLSVLVKRGMKSAVEDGLFPHNAPIGYLDMGQGKPKEPDPDRTPLIKEAYDLYATGAYSVETLLTVMQEKGLRTKKGQLINRSRLHRILTNIFYYGKFEWNKGVYQGMHEPIISEELFNQVKELLEKKNKTYKTMKPYAYRKLLRCGECGYYLSPMFKKNKHMYYYCAHDDCSQKTVLESAIDKEIFSILQKIAFTNEELEGIRDKFNEVEDHLNSYRNHKISFIAKKEKKLLGEQDRIRKLVIDGVFDSEVYQQENKRIQNELEEIKLERDKLDTLNRQRMNEVFDFLELSKKTAAYYLNGTAEEKSEIVQNMFLELYVKDRQLAKWRLKEDYEKCFNRHETSHVLNGRGSRI